MSTPAVCAIDVGTTSTRAILFSRDGSEIAKHQIEYSTSAQSGSRRGSPRIFSDEGIALNTDDVNLVIETEPKRPTLMFPNPGWVECNPVHILNNVVQCLAEVAMTLEMTNSESLLSGEPSPQYRVASIGIANMRETTVVWSKATGKPLYNGIVWNDTRTAGLMKQVKKEAPESLLEEVYERSGCPVSTYFSCLKLRWLYQNVPEVRKSYESGEGDLMFGTIDTWLIYNLTTENSFLTDVTNASRTSFMNLKTLQYDKKLLRFWNVDPTKINLPEIVPSSHQFGTFTIPKLVRRLPEDMENCLLNAFKGVSITGCLGDQSASLVGQTAFHLGDAKCTYGTGAFLLYNTGPQPLTSKHGVVTTVGYWFDSLDPEVDGEHCGEPHYCLEGSIAVAGSCVQWLRDNLKLIDKASDIGPLAAAAKDSAGIVFVPAFSGLFAPYWDPLTTGTIFGITQYSTSAHIARAAIEGVCFQVRAILKAMLNDTGDSAKFLEDSSGGNATDFNMLHVDGGMAKSDVVMQIQADILGPCVGVRRADHLECTALGAAIASGLQVGVWSSLKDVTSQLNATQGGKFHATLGDDKRQKMWRLWGRAVDRASGWLEG